MNTAKLLNAHGRLTSEKLKITNHHEAITREGTPVHVYRIQDVKDGDIYITVQHVGRNRASAMANWICAITNTIGPLLAHHLKVVSDGAKMMHRVRQLEGENLRLKLQIERLTGEKVGNK